MGALKYYNPDTSSWEYVVNPNYVSSSISEEMTGTINGSNTVFTTSSPFAAIDVYKNGVHMRPGASNDYTITGANQITFVTAPATGSSLSASYSTANSGLIVGSNSIITKEIPTGTVNGTNAAFTTAMSYVAGSLQVYVNGLAQSTFVTETSPAAGTFSLDVAPLTGDNVRVSYQHTGSVSGNADTVDGYHASITPTAGLLLPLNSRAQSGEWWEEIGRTTLSSSSNTISVTFTPKKYLTVKYSQIGTGGGIGTTLRFNGSSSGYSFRYVDNAGGEGTSTSATELYPDIIGTVGTLLQGEFIITNIATQEKVVRMQMEHAGTAGATNLPLLRRMIGKWTNTTDQISTLTIATSSGTLASGTEIIVLGHN